MEFYLESKSKIIVDNDIFDTILVVNTECFPKGKTVLVLAERVINESLGECIPINLLKCANKGSFFKSYNNVKWDVGIIILNIQHFLHISIKSVN